MKRIILRTIEIILWVLVAFVGFFTAILFTASNSLTTSGIVAAIFGCPMAIIAVIAAAVHKCVPPLTDQQIREKKDRKENREKRKAAAKAQTRQNGPRNDIYLSDEQLLQIVSGGLPDLIETEAILKPGEQPAYSAAATLLITKKRAVGRMGGGAGVSFRVAKGVSFHTGGGESRTVFGDITDRYPGRLLITSQRIIFLQNQKGFDQNIDKLTSLAPYKDGVGIQFGSTTYTLATPEPQYPVQVIQTIINR